MAIEDELRSVRTQINQVQSKKARAAVELETAEERKAEARAVLTEFNIETGEDAKRVRAELEQKLETAVINTRTALEEAGA